MFFKIMHGKKQIFCENGKIKKNKGFFQFFLQFLSNNETTFFCTRPEKKIDTRKSRKGISRNAQKQKRWNRQGMKTTQ